MAYHSQRECAVCGEMFTPKSSRNKYCNQQKTAECQVCGKEITYKCSPQGIKRYCSYRCGALAPETREKIKKTSLERYGVENSMYLDKFKQQVMESQIKKYGKLAFNTDKQKQTMIERYGVEVPSKNKEVQKKIRETQYKNNGGVYAFNTEKQRQTMIERYGGAGSLSSPEVLKKQRQTMKERYGHENTMHIPEIRKKALDKIIENNGQLFGGGNNISKKNQLFKDSLEAVGLQSTFEKRVENSFFDLHIVDTNILVDINPTVSHNSHIAFACERTHCKTIPCEKHTPTSSSYHLGRSKIAARNNYDLVQVFDWDDWDVVISSILKRLENPGYNVGEYIDLSKTTILREDSSYSYTGPLCVWVNYKSNKLREMHLGDFLANNNEYESSEEYKNMIISGLLPVWTPGFALSK